MISCRTADRNCICKMLKYILSILTVLLIIALVILYHPAIQVSTSQELQAILERPLQKVEIRLKPGIYRLQPVHFTDPSCGNCQDPEMPVAATYGAKISGNDIIITGPENHSAIIETNAGYGLYLRDCENLLLENLTITGGIRDTAAMASDAAIVVSNSSVTISNNRIVNNIGDSLLIARHITGIMGICGRENSHLTIINNEILGNSWDGIALYRQSEAVISGNIIDGIDNAGREAGGGRGVAIGITWDARAEVRDNLIRHYWKGIGIFVNGQAEVSGNIIENCLTWGISLWDAGQGYPRSLITDNIIYHTGAMGAALTSQTTDDPGCFCHNIIVETAGNPAYDDPDYYGYQCALAVHELSENFLIEENIFHLNRRATPDLPDQDISVEEFQVGLPEIFTRFQKHPLWQQSSFYHKFFRQER